MDLITLEGPLPFLPTDGADAHFQSLCQPFEQQRQQEVLFTSPSTSALLPTSSYSIDQSLLVDMTISVASLMQTYQEEMNWYLQLQNERLVESLFEQRKRHVDSLLNNLQAKAAVLLKVKEDNLSIAIMRHQELCERLKKTEESKELWESIARQNAAQVSSLRRVLEQIQQPQFSSTNPDTAVGINSTSPMEIRKELKPAKDGDDKVIIQCRCCGAHNACQLLLPCRHLCTCKQCTDILASCPVCSSKIRGNVKVLF
ncbi:probable BOI-related E3 ubiquitin-protein ligase 2 isoform X1 [Zingiber officinale]|uniref:probable BOI-related E3 ubiquitin-protein ligase 2 isoform X1 n=1 Tax=Zingiber officinale TaxID=94328 RepID=UPI001C4DB848|nr:probable BOI-related E3 ubiquitin-protein ligase 2 isoform X1 [Zingiber officinale]